MEENPRNIDPQTSKVNQLVAGLITDLGVASIGDESIINGDNGQFIKINLPKDSKFHDIKGIFVVNDPNSSSTLLPTFLITSNNQCVRIDNKDDIYQDNKYNIEAIDAILSGERDLDSGYKDINAMEFAEENVEITSKRDGLKKQLDLAKEYFENKNQKYEVLELLSKNESTAQNTNHLKNLREADSNIAKFQRDKERNDSRSDYGAFRKFLLSVGDFFVDSFNAVVNPSKNQQSYEGNKDQPQHEIYQTAFLSFKPEFKESQEAYKKANREYMANILDSKCAVSSGVKDPAARQPESVQEAQKKETKPFGKPISDGFGDDIDDDPSKKKKSKVKPGIKAEVTIQATKGSEKERRASTLTPENKQDALEIGQSIGGGKGKGGKRNNANRVRSNSSPLPRGKGGQPNNANRLRSNSSPLPRGKSGGRT